MSGVRLLFVLVAIGWTVARLSGSAIGFVWRARAPMSAGAVHPWSRWAPYLLLLPVLLGVTAAVGSVIPSDPTVWLWGACPCQVYPAEGMHLCIFHPGAAAPLFPIGLGIVALFVVESLPRSVVFFRSLRAVRRLVAMAVPAGPVVQVDLGGAPAAFTTGVHAPRVYVDRAWWERLDLEGRRVVLAHERSHAEHRDPATRLLLEVLRLIAAPISGAGLVDAWRLSAELRADRDAANAVADPIRVARFLVAQARCSRPALALGLSADGLECRVRALLDGRTVEPAPTGAAGLAFFAALLSELALLGPVLHRAAELYMNTRT